MMLEAQMSYLLSPFSENIMMFYAAEVCHWTLTLHADAEIPISQANDLNVHRLRWVMGLREVLWRYTPNADAAVGDLWPSYSTSCNNVWEAQIKHTFNDVLCKLCGFFKIEFLVNNINPACGLRFLYCWVNFSQKNNFWLFKPDCDCAGARASARDGDFNGAGLVWKLNLECDFNGFSCALLR